MAQLLLSLEGMTPKTLDNFFGQDYPHLLALRRLLSGDEYVSSIYLWGEVGTGKTHLLQALKQYPQTCWWDPLDDALNDDLRQIKHQIFLLDNFSTYQTTPDTWLLVQERLFRLFLSLNRETQNTLVMADQTPFQFLPLRSDVSSRLAWGLSYELPILSDVDKKQCLRRYLNDKQLRVDDQVLEFLMLHLPRDMGALVGYIDRLISYAYQNKEPLTLRRVQGWVSSQIKNQ
jgi:DnaA family protein